ncbi:SIMPL domain-containing protein [Patescibacteria group bacterium]|nr:SIMPL domain-containing protein [Patescibacteria group bacterium]
MNNTTLKNYLLLTVIGTLIVFGLSIVWFVASYSKATEPASFRSFQVLGEGSVTTIPDIAQFSFGVITQGGIDLAVTQEENTREVNAAIAFLKEQNIEEKDISTKAYQVSPRYQYYICNGENGPCPPAEIVGYTVQQTVQVKVRDFSVIGGLLAGVVENGANSVSQLSFTIDDPTQVQNEARAKAIKKAKEKAQAIAEAGGFKVGRLLSIQESFSPSFGYVTLESSRGEAPSPPAPSIEPGSQEVSVVMTLKYEIR